MRDRGRVREEWEIKEDARTLAMAEEIRADRERMLQATEMASRMASERMQEISGLLKISGRSNSKEANSLRGRVNALPFDKSRYHNPATICKL